MPTTHADADLTSELSNNLDLLLGAENGFDVAEYAQIARRIGIVGGEAATTVSAFNSSI